MKTHDRNETGIVIECFDHNALHRVLVVQSNDVPRMYQFLYVRNAPPVDFGDTVHMNFEDSEFYVYRGNPKLTFKIVPLIFPGTLLMELITEYSNL